MTVTSNMVNTMIARERLKNTYQSVPDISVQSIDSSDLTPEQQVLEQRKQIEEQKQKYLEATKEINPEYTRRRQFTPRTEREVRRQASTELAASETEFNKQVSDYEINIAKNAPELGKPEYVTVAYNESLSAIQNEIAKIDARILNKQQAIENKRIWWNNKSSSYRSDPNHRKSYADDLHEYEDEIDILQAQKDGWRSSISSTNDTIKKYFSGYAQDYAQYKSDKREAQINNRNQFNRDLENGKLDAMLKQLNLDKSNINYSNFNKAISDYNSKAAYNNSLIKWGEKVGFDKLPVWAQQQVNPNLANYIKENSGEKLFFKGNEIVSVSSALFRQSMPFENYLKQVKYLQDNAPLIKYYNPITEKMYDTQQGVNVGKLFLPNKDSNYRVYVDPRTNKPIDDLNAYLKEKKLPTTYSDKQLKWAELLKELQKPKIKDVRTLSSEINEPGYVTPFFIGPVSGPGSTAAAVELGLTLSGVKFLAQGGALAPRLLKGGSLIFSKPLTEGLNVGYTKLPEPASVPGQFLKSALFFGTAEAINPSVGLAYGKELVTSFSGTPKETTTSLIEFAKTPEFYGALFGGGIIRTGGRLTNFLLPEKGIKTARGLSYEFKDIAFRPTARAIEFIDINTMRPLNNKQLLVEDIKSGQRITPGGGIDEIKSKFPEYKDLSKAEFRKIIYSDTLTGARIRQAALLAELKQELGLTKNQILKIEELGFNQQLGEGQFNFRLFVDGSKIIFKPKSDVRKVVFVRPWESYNLSAKFPTGRPTLFGLLPSIRSKEAMSIAQKAKLEKSLGGTEKIEIIGKPVEQFSLGLLPDMLVSQKFVMERIKTIGEDISLENLNRMIQKKIITKNEYTKLRNRIVENKKITITTLIKETNIVGRAKNELKKFGKAELNVMTNKEIVKDYILYKEGQLFQYLREKVGPNKYIVYGSTSLYDRTNQKKFTDIIQKVEKYYGKKELQRIPVERVEDILKIMDIAQPDIIFYKTFVKEHLVGNRAFLTHLAQEPLSAESLRGFFLKERTIQAGKSKRTSGGLRGLYAAPELFKKGDIGARGQIRKTTVGYGGLVYFGLGTYKGTRFTLSPVIKKPTTYFTAAKVSGEAYKERVIEKMSVAEAIKYLENKVGSIQPTINSLLSLESEVAITPGTKVIIGKLISVGRIAGYKQKTYKLIVKVLTKTQADYITKNLKAYQKSKNLIVKQNAVANLKKVLGESYRSEYANYRYVQVPIPKVMKVAESEKPLHRTIEFILPKERPIGKIEKPVKAIKESKIPRAKESKIPKLSELKVSRFFELPNVKEKPMSLTKEIPSPKITEIKIPQRTPLRFSLVEKTREEKGKRKLVLKKEKKKPRAFQLTPTLAQETINYKRAKPLLLSSVTGFEIARV